MSSAASSYPAPPPSAARGTIHISPDLDQQIRDAVVALGTSKVEWVELALREKLARDWTEHNDGQPFPSVGRARPGRRIGRGG
jgi:hypothetical protein